jgi:hypothetical protein
MNPYYATYEIPGLLSVISIFFMNLVFRQDW